jgi:benzylsuccinate CoA-transferase BbsF subunit
MKERTAKLPLEGIRVADFSWIINGPQIAQWLATMGAEVIKIESQIYIDIGRINPSGMADRIQGPNRNGYYHALNYSKKAITLNLASEKGRALADEIIRKSDIVLECFPTPAANKLGITYERVRAVKPDIIMMSVSLLGKTGREPASWVGWGPMACSFVGMFDAQGYPDLENPNPPPRQTGGTWPDYAVAGAVTFHILAALRHRNRTGEGQWIDASMGETVIGQMPEWYMDYFINGRDRHGIGNRDDAMAPHNTYPCAGDDKWIAIAVGTQSEWEALCGAMGDPAWTRDARFADQYSRRQNSDDLDAHLATWTRNHEHLALAKELQAAGVAAGPVLDSVELHDDPHLWEWGYLRKINHHEVGERILPNMPVHMSNVPELHFSLPPDLGQHNRDIFGGLLGLSDAEINLLMDQKVIY